MCSASKSANVSLFGAIFNDGLTLNLRQARPSENGAETNEKLVVKKKKLSD